MKDKEFLQHIQKSNWKAVKPNLDGPKELKTISEANLKSFKNLSAAATWAAESIMASWCLNIEDDRYFETATDIVFSEPSGEGSQMAAGYAEVHVAKNKKARVFLHFSNNKTEGSENILALLASVRLASHAELEIFVVQNQTATSNHIFNLSAELAEAAQLRIYHVSGGASWSECDYHFTQNGEYSFSDLKVLQLGVNEQRHRLWASSYMNSSYTKTSQLVKCLLNGKSKNHFVGRIHIGEGITEVDAFQRNQNLLLSRQAQALNQPELEVLSDNVKAAHGSATGFMNQDELFYLQSRGLSEQEGRQFLAEAFALSLFSNLESSMLTKAKNTLSERIANVCS